MPSMACPFCFAPVQAVRYIAESAVFAAQINCFVYIASMATISPITIMTNIHGEKTARAISLAISTKTITKTIITR
ncbi:hypothetical protein F4827_001838 [Paraburkholderia bannensis]|uniref:Uncharacterized protein n=1 Tax=Paraburkholderia bannensis TaxID=765414 RepID=A0A7W9TX57_9BURK|nr:MULTISPECIES: hypothetical protein [Paraburkholderia]MBB3257036.1 hypothetical protein [Paraburkholderia sp. WP4_3_2]MBB6101990.1 hypothetical protein [Paraburkholderia bannensis]